LAGGEGFEVRERRSADQEGGTCQGFAVGHSPSRVRGGFGEDTVGGESGHIGPGDAVEEAGTVELLRGKGEFEVRGGGGGRGLALTDRPALICQHSGNAELAHAVADAVVDADDNEEPGFDEVCLHTEDFQWTHGWVVPGRCGAEIFGQQFLLAGLALSQFLNFIRCRKISDSQVGFAFVMVSETALLFAIPRLWRLRTAAG